MFRPRELVIRYEAIFISVFLLKNVCDHFIMGVIVHWLVRSFLLLPYEFRNLKKKQAKISENEVKLCMF